MVEKGWARCRLSPLVVRATSGLALLGPSGLLIHDAACERFYEQDTRVRTVSRSQVKQPVNSRGIGRWLPYEAHLQPLIAALEEGGALSRDAG